MPKNPTQKRELNGNKVPHSKIYSIFIPPIFLKLISRKMLKTQDSRLLIKVNCSPSLILCQPAFPFTFSLWLIVAQKQIMREMRIGKKILPSRPRLQFILFPLQTFGFSSSFHIHIFPKNPIKKFNCHYFDIQFC